MRTVLRRLPSLAHLRSWWRRLLLPLLLPLLLLAGPDALGQAPVPDQMEADKLVVRYLLNFLYAAQWPKAADPFALKRLRVGIMDDPELAEVLVQIAGQPKFKEKFRNVPIEVKPSGNPAEVLDCQLVFAGTSDPVRIKTLLQALANRPALLIVGQSKDFAELGGTIALYPTKSGTMAFELNLDHLAQTGVDFPALVKSQAVAFIRQGRREANPNRPGGAP